MASVRCSVGVRFSEGPLWEVPLYTNDQSCDKISVNNVNLVIQQQIASGKDYCISLIKAPLNMEIDMMIKCNTPMINVVIRSL